MIPSARLVRLSIGVLRVVPAPVARWLARAVGRIAFALARDRRRVLLENQRYLSPDATPREQRARARRTMVHLTDSAIDLFRLPSASREELARLVGVSGREHLDRAMAMGRGVVAVTAHLGPYELGGAWLALAGYPVHAMVEELSPETNAALALYREATGMRLLSRNGGLRAALRLLRAQQVVLLVADRVVGDGSDGVVVRFGAGERAVPTGPAALALATGAPIIVGTITRTGARAPRYLVELAPPIVAEATADGRANREQLTRRIAERLAAAVVAHPDEWFVFQPEWMTASPLARAQHRDD
jgi:KDO2-lipid IV(A) lauroyltransferase